MKDQSTKARCNTRQCTAADSQGTVISLFLNLLWSVEVLEGSLRSVTPLQYFVRPIKATHMQLEIPWTYVILSRVNDPSQITVFHLGEFVTQNTRNENEGSKCSEQIFPKIAYL
jgi:hypothetical protein